MMYLAIELGSDGGTILEPQTGELRTIEVGDYQTKADAVKNACQMLDCGLLYRGVIRRNKGNSGYMVLNAQDYAAI